MSIITAETLKGSIKGVQKEGYTVFKGIPYAKPPVAELRWKAPEEMECWDGVYEATAFPDASMQEVRTADPLYQKEFYSNPEFLYKPSEDSLYLNIWTPAKGTEDHLPVAFWIHGGAFSGGNGSKIEFDGEEYCKRGVILVTINYRLNIFGFLAHPWLSAESEHGVSGNYGILDQIAALRWVQNNIRAFGGDPENITVFGQSAGAMSVQTLVSTELTGNTISKAIMQSGGGFQNGFNSDDMTLKHAEEIGVEITEGLGIESLEQFRGMSANDVVSSFSKISPAIFKREKKLFMVPIIDGYVLKGSHDALVDQSKVKNIPYILGSTKDDIFVDPEEAKAGISSLLLKGCLSWGQKLDSQGIGPSYVYEFRRNLPGDEAGAFHSSELWYMFGTMKRCWRPWEEHDHDLSQQMLRYWTNFIKNGNPNGTDVEKWRPCTKEDKYYKVFE